MNAVLLTLAVAAILIWLMGAILLASDQAYASDHGWNSRITLRVALRIWCWPLVAIGALVAGLGRFGAASMAIAHEARGRHRTIRQARMKKFRDKPRGAAPHFAHRRDRQP